MDHPVEIAPQRPRLPPHPAQAFQIGIARLVCSRFPAAQRAPLQKGVEKGGNSSGHVAVFNLSGVLGGHAQIADRQSLRQTSGLLSAWKRFFYPGKRIRKSSSALAQFQGPASGFAAGLAVRSASTAASTNCRPASGASGVPSAPVAEIVTSRPPMPVTARQ